jgi:hypothetical protein
MKTLFIMLALVALSFGASAQRKSGYYHARSRIIIAPSISYGLGFGYPYFGYPVFGYPYGYGNPYYGPRRMPYKLSLEIQSIRIDYKDKIRKARHDKSLSSSQRRQEIRALKTERDQQIIDAQRNFSFNRRGKMNDQNQGPNYNQNQGMDNQNPGN